MASGNEVGELLWKLGVNPAGFNKGIDKSKKKVGGLQSFVKKAGLAIGATFAAMGVAKLGTKFVKLAIGMEQTRVSFTTFLKSADKADKTIKELQNFSVVTPFTIDQINKAGKSMLAMGFGAEELIPNMQKIGDIAAGTGKDFNELALIYAKAKTAGTLMAEDINQLVEAGVPIMGEFAKSLGVTEGEVKKLASTGALKFKDLETAFTNLTDEGGLFFNLMEDQSATLGGKISTLEGNFSLLGASIGGLSTGIIGNLVDELNDLIEPTEDLETTTNGLVKENARLAKVRKILSSATTQLTEDERNLLEVEEDQLALSLDQRILDINKAFREAAGDTGLFSDSLKQQQKEIDKTRAQLEKAKKIYDEFASGERGSSIVGKLKDVVSGGTEVIADAVSRVAGLQVDASKSQENALSEQERLTQKLIDLKQGEINTTSNLTGGINALTTARINGTLTESQFLSLEKDIQKQINENLDAQKERNRILAEREALEAKALEDAEALTELAKKNKRLAEETKKNKEKEDKILAKQLEKIKEFNKETAKLASMGLGDLIEPTQLELLDEGLKKYEAIKNLVMGIATAGVSFAQAIVGSKIEDLDAQLAKDLEAIDARTQAELESKGLLEESEVMKLEREKQAAIDSGDLTAAASIQNEIDRTNIINKGIQDRADAEKKAAKEKADLEYKGALAGWSLQLAGAVAQAPVAVLNAFSSGAAVPIAGLSLGPAFAAIAGVTAALQIASIVASKPKKPSFAVGISDVPRDMDASIHKGEMIIPKTFADDVRNDKISLGGGKAASQFIVQIMTNPSEVLDEYIFEGTESGTIKIHPRGLISV